MYPRCTARDLDPTCNSDRWKRSLTWETRWSRNSTVDVSRFALGGVPGRSMRYVSAKNLNLKKTKKGIKDLCPFYGWSENIFAAHMNAHAKEAECWLALHSWMTEKLLFGDQNPGARKKAGHNHVKFSWGSTGSSNCGGCCYISKQKTCESWLIIQPLVPLGDLLTIPSPFRSLLCDRGLPPQQPIKILEGIGGLGAPVLRCPRRWILLVFPSCARNKSEKT